MYVSVRAISHASLVLVGNTTRRSCWISKHTSCLPSPVASTRTPSIWRCSHILATLAFSVCKCTNSLPRSTGTTIQLLLRLGLTPPRHAPSAAPLHPWPDAIFYSYSDSEHCRANCGPRHTPLAYIGFPSQAVAERKGIGFPYVFGEVRLFSHTTGRKSALRIGFC